MLDRPDPPRSRWLVLALSLAALACTRGKTDTTAPDGGTPPPVVADSSSSTDPEPPQDACRSWADLDVSTLPPLPQTPYTATLEQVWRTVLDKHYDPTLNCLDWPAIRVEYGGKLTEAKDEAAAYAVITEMLGRLGQSHLAVVPPRQRVAGEPRAAVKSGDARVPVEARVIDGEVVVVDDALDGHRSGLPRGAKLIAIDDAELAEIVTGMKERHPDREVEATFAVRRTVTSLLSCPTGAKRRIRFEPLGAKAPKDKSVPCQPIEAERVSLGNLKNIPAVVEHRMLPGSKVGYIAFNIWMLPLVPKIEAGLEQLRKQGMEALILDLRGNPGGVGAMVVPVGRLILSEPADLGTMNMREGKQTFNVSVGEDPFTGPIALLVDEGTASTSEIFGQALQDLGRVTVFGAVPSQGAALPSVIEELPGGAMLQYVVADYQSPKGIAVEGKGVIPDTVVPETRQDFAKGRDPVLEAALAALRGKGK
ncbi:S41 family peptidase [Paraliomyxa miuraensis]|uniref:S41 family peptidase n=1 Tax=Paraliomyxa miuraensis TaxID=376150 RepID=UPI002259A8B8|nr:S41 family peptidase [Paraliomyxa miuraensis]MCX4242462.1 S41 family peptidase [Paraliomyxa miuraensis]